MGFPMRRTAGSQTDSSPRLFGQGRFRSRRTYRVQAVWVRAFASALLLCTAASACGESDGSSAESSEDVARTEVAFDACSNSEVLNELFDAPLWEIEEDFSSHFSLGDEGKTLVADGVHAYWMPVLACMLNELDTSDATIAAIDSTTAMSGTQESTDGDVSYQWTYHPDNGLNLIVTDDS